MTFSNRCFPTKAIAVWQALDSAGHLELVSHDVCEAGNWTDIQALDRSPRLPGSDPLFAVVARSLSNRPTRAE